MSNNKNDNAKVRQWPAILISCVALIISVLALWISYCSYRDSRAVAKLDIWPEIELDGSLVPKRKMPRYVAVSNRGPGDALELSVQLLSHFYDRPKDRTMSIYGSQEEFHYKVLKAQDSARITLSDHWFDVNAQLQKPKDHNVIEIRIEYRRPADMKKRKMSAYFFLSPDGIWVSENSNSIDGEPYDSLKREIFERHDKIPIRYPSIKLHLHE